MLFRRGSILIIDDDEAVREYLHALLAHAGYTVLALAGGREAIAYLKRVKVDAILLDLMMPEVDGWTVLAELRADPALRDTPIVILSAAGGQLVDGVAARLVKPSSSPEVLATVARVLGRDRRQSPRYAARFGLTVGDEHATTREVSAGGLSFETVSAPRIGARFSMTVDLAVHGPAAVEIEVRHVARVARAGWLVGAQFLAFQQNAVGFADELALLARSSPLP